MIGISSLSADLGCATSHMVVPETIIVGKSFTYGRSICHGSDPSCFELIFKIELIVFVAASLFDLQAHIFPSDLQTYMAPH